MRFRWLVIAIAAGAFVVLLAIGAGTWLTGSERGTRWLLTTALERVGPQISIGRIAGTLREELTLGDVTVIVNGDRVTIGELTLVLDLGGILSRTLVVEELRSTNVTYTRLGGGPPAASGGGFLPIAIDIRRASLESLTLEGRDGQLAFDATSFRAVLADDRIVIEDLETQSQDVRMTGRGEIDLQAPLRLVAQVDWSAERDQETASGRLIVGGTLPELDLSHELFAPFDVTAAGKLWLEETPRIDMLVQWRDVTVAGVEDGAGSANLRGAVTALEYESTGAFRAYGREFEYSATGTVNGSALAFAPLTLSAASGTVSARGEVDLESLQWRMTLAARDLDTGALAASWPGRIDLDGNLFGGLEPLEIRAETLDVTGRVRGLPFTAVASGDFAAPSRLSIDALDVDAGGNTLQVSGTIDERVDLVLMADLGDLRSLRSDLAGSLLGNVRVAGTVQRPVLSGRIEAQALELGEYAVANAEVEGSVAADPDAQVALDFTATGLTVDGFDVASLHAELEGTPRAHRVQIDASSPQWSSALTARGNLEADHWVATIEDARLTQQELGEWRLAEPAALELARARVRLQASCLSQAGADLCASLTIVGQSDDEIVLSARNFDLRSLQPFFPEHVSVAGVYQMAATIQNPVGDPQGRVALTGGPTRLHVELGADRVVDSALESIVLGADLDAGRLELRLDVNGGDAGRVNLRTTIDDVEDRSSRTSGQLDVLWTDLAFLSLLSPDVGGVSGTVAAQLELGGTVEDPELSGRGQFSGGAVEVPAWGLRIERIESTAVTRDGATLEYSGTGFVDEQEVRLRGTTELDIERSLPTRLELDGDSLHLVQLADTDMFVSPDLDIDVALPDIDVTGTLHVPRALITLDELPQQAQRPSTDSVVHGVGDEAPPRALRMDADVRVTLGDDVHYNGSNLMTDLAGELSLDYESGRATRASGALTIAGTYNAYGQVLQLERGELLFTGPLDDPALDVRAEREIGETTVGVQLTGTLKAPVTRIYSDPMLSEADALAYLLLGRPLAGTGEQETATLESAALAMGLQQALPAVQRIGSTLGLDELSIQTTDIDAGALMAGKYLSPKLYVRYTYGLFNRIGGLLVRFRFNERLSLETRSGDDKSMDLLYTVEKN
jgi:translocation and assembly module TamB